MPKKKQKTNYGKLKSEARKLCDYILNRDILLAIALTIVIVFAGLFLGWYNNKVVPVNTMSTAHYVQEPNNKLSFISNWDGPDYISISQNGYVDVDNTNFFPLYPMLIHTVNKVISSPLYSALLVSWVSLVGAFYFYLKVIKKLFKIKNNYGALKGLLLFVLFPTSVFLIATYTESLFAFLALASIYYVLQKRYLLASFFALFASATHVTGVFLLILLFGMMLEEKEKIVKAFGYICIGGLGLITYMAYLFKEYGNPISFVTAQKSHGWVQSGYIHNLRTTSDVLNLVFIALLIASVIYWWSRKRSFSIYSFTFLLIPLLGGQFGGFDRYVLMAFPVQFMLYEHFRDRVLAYSLILTSFAVLWTYTLLQYAGGYTGS